MKLNKRKVRKITAVLLTFVILILTFYPVGNVKIAYAEEEEAVIKLYKKTTVIGEYKELKDVFDDMTDKSGEYKIEFGAGQDKYTVNGEIWLPECKSITFSGVEVDKWKYSSTAIVIDDSIHMQSDVIIDTCTIYYDNDRDTNVLDVGNHKFTIIGVNSDIVADNGFYSNGYTFKIWGKEGSEFILKNTIISLCVDISIDILRLEKSVSLTFLGCRAKINKVILKDNDCGIGYQYTGSYNSSYRIGEIQLNNTHLNISLGIGVKLDIGKVTMGKNDDPNVSYLFLFISDSEYQLTKDNYPHFNIESITDVHLHFQMQARVAAEYKQGYRELVHNKLSFVKVSKDYDINNIDRYKLLLTDAYDDIRIMKDSNGNIWMNMIDEIKKDDDDKGDTDENLCYELNEEQRDMYGIYYKLNDSEKTATVGTDKDISNNAGYNVEGNTTRLSIPAYVKLDGITYDVTRIGKSALQGISSKNIEYIYIPDTVISIGDKAFYESAITNIIIGKNVSEIGDKALSSLGLRKLELSSDNEIFALYKGALFDKNMTTLIRCPCDNENDYDGIYYVPKTVKKIKAGAFYSSDISSINADSVESMEEYAFENVDRLRTVSLKSVREISDYAFGNAVLLKNVYMSDCLEKVGCFAFQYCKNLEGMILPDSVKEVGDYAFYNSSIKFFAGGVNATYGESVFSGCSNLSIVQLGNEMEVLPDNIFSQCTSLNSLYLPESYQAFELNCFTALSQNHMTIYGSESQKDIIENANMHFENKDEHEHDFVTEVIQRARIYEKGIEATYCTKCHYVLSYKWIDALEDYDKPAEEETKEPVHPAEEEQPSASPTPTLIPTVSPVMTPAPTKTPTVTVKPTKTPAATATVPSPTPIMTGSPLVVSPTAIPINSTSAMPNGHVSSKPDKEPEPTSGNKTTPNPTDRTTPQPADNASPSPANEPLYTISPTPTSATTQPTSVPGLSEKDKKALIVRINLIELTKYNQPEIVWKKTSVNIGYEIYRAMSKKITWKKIAAGETNSSCRYTDKKAKAGQKYYYKMRLFKKTGGQKYYGKYSNVCMIKTLSIVKPKIKGTTGTYQKMPYVQIELKKYSGIYAEIYIRGKDKKYQKIKLKSSSIKRYNAKFKLKCNNKKAVYYFKVRTIVKWVKKKYYSVYSDCLKVKVKGS